MSELTIYFPVPPVAGEYLTGMVEDVVETDRFGG